MKVEVRHATELTYDRPVGETVMEVRLQPLEGPRQSVGHFELVVEPKADIRSYRDGFGNIVHYFNYLPPHDRVLVTAHSFVETFAAPSADPDGFPEDYLFFRPPVLDVAGIRRLAARFSGGEVATRLDALALAINRSFEYMPETTDVYTQVDEVLRLRRGVCQDFAHLFIAACRSLRVPARYVSGYIHAGVGHHGAGASHAWAEAYVEGIGWIGYDPTNPVRAGEQHVRVAVGRDYRDVAPTRGSYVGTARETMKVTVTTQVL